MAPLTAELSRWAFLAVRGLRTVLTRERDLWLYLILHSTRRTLLD